MLKHQHVVVKAHVRDPIKSEAGADEWIRNLISSIGMELAMGPWSWYSEMPGNRGLTTSAIITTSHIAMHIWDEEDPAVVQLDVYSCACVDLDVVFAALKCMDPVRIAYKFMDREDDFKVISEGVRDAA